MTTSILSIIETLGSDNSKLFKERTLKENADNDLLKHFFYLALDPQVQFYQRKIPAYTLESKKPLIDLSQAMGDIVETLVQRRLTGNAAIEFLSNVLSSVSKEDAEVIERMVQKDPKCGVSTSTVNKVWPGLIFEFPVMLCSKLEEKTVKKLHWKDGVFVQLKSDGLRCQMVISETGAVSMYTRNGKPIDTFGRFDMIGLEVKGAVIDGELLVKRDGKILDRKTGNGVINKFVKQTATQEMADELFFMVWDIISLPYWKAGLDAKVYSERFAVLTYKVNLLNQYYPAVNIGLIKSDIVHSLEEAEVIYENYLKQKEEGVILKDPTSIWENARSKFLIKMKAEETADLLCVGWNPGTGKYENHIGSLICESACGKLKVSIPGRGDEMRTADHKEYVGKIIEVQYNMRITKRNSDIHSLFLPKFVQVRDDKDVANTLEEIK